jgi:hypothetical protein
MEIESIPEVEEDIEAEKSEYNTSNLGLEFNRVETEYGEEEQSYDLYSIEEVFKSYLVCTAVYLASLVFLMISFMGLAKIFLFLIPLAGFEVYLVIKNLTQYKEELSILSKFWKSEFFVKALGNFCEIVMLGLVAVILSGKMKKIIWMALPMGFNIVSRSLLKVNLANGCINFEDIVWAM